MDNYPLEKLLRAMVLISHTVFYVKDNRTRKRQKMWSLEIGEMKLTVPSEIPKLFDTAKKNSQPIKRATGVFC